MADKTRKKMIEREKALDMVNATRPTGRIGALPGGKRIGVIRKETPAGVGPKNTHITKPPTTKGKLYKRTLVAGGKLTATIRVPKRKVK